MLLKLALSLLLAGVAASAQTVAVTGTRITDSTGSPASGLLCLGTTCATVAAGSVNSTLPTGTANLILKDSSGKDLWTLWHYPLTSPLNIDTLVVGDKQMIGSSKAPWLACGCGSLAIEMDTTPMSMWSCGITASGTTQWVNISAGPTTMSCPVK